MSRSVDTRVVEMQFDNAAFERGVKQTMSSLTALDKKLQTGTNVNSFQNLENSANKVRFSKLQNALGTIVSSLETVGSRALQVFGTMTDGVTTFGKVAALSITGMGTALAGLAITGGWRRAANIEQAKFQLKGLGVEWAAISDDLNYAVEGTAYGLDSAAKVASQLVASNIQVGDSMKTALRAVSGVSAMTNREYDDIGHIFTTIAGNGRVMTEQLNQLATSGLNAASTLAKYLNVSEAELREMVSKGKIDFETFAKAMDDAFGEHAKEANATFTGALSNVKAALSRIGAEFATPLRENLRRVFVDAIDLFKDFKSITDPIAQVFGAATESIADHVTTMLQQFHASGGLKQVGTELSETINSIRYALTSKGESQGITDIFNEMRTSVNVTSESLDKLEKHGVKAYDMLAKSLGVTNDEIKNMASNGKISFRVFADAMVDAGYASDNVKNVVDEVARTVKIMGTNAGYALKAINSGISDAFGDITPTFESVLNFFRNIRKHVANLSFTPKTLGEIRDVAFKLATIFQSLTNVARKLFEALGPVAGAALSMLWTGFQRVVDFLYELHNYTADLVGEEDLNRFFNDVSNSARKFFETLKNGIPSVDTIRTGFDRLREVVKGVGSVITSVFSTIRSTLGPVIDTLKSLFRDIFGDFSLGDIFSMFNAAGVLGLATSLSAMVTTFREMKSTFEEGGFLKLFTGEGLDKITGVLDQLGGVLEAWQTNLNASMLLKIAAAIGVLALSLTLLAKQDPEKLLQGIAAIGLLMAMMGKLVAFLMDLSMFSSGAAGIMGLTKVGTAFVAIAVSLVLMSAAVKLLGSMDLDKAAQGVAGLGIIMLELLVFMNYLGIFMETKASVKAVTSIIGELIPMTIALIGLAAVVKILGSMDFESWAKGLGGLAIIMAELVAMFAVMDNVLTMADSAKQISKVVMSLIPMAAALLILAASMKIIGGMDFESWAKGLGGLAILMVELCAALYLFSDIDTTGVLSGAAAMLIVANSMLVMSAAMLMLGQMSFEQMATAIFAVAAAFLLMGVALAAISSIDFSTEAAIDIMLVAAAIAVLAPALTLLSTIPLEGVAIALGAIAGAFIIFGVAAMVVSSMEFQFAAFATTLLAISAAALMTGLAITLVAVGLETLSAITGSKLQNIANSITTALGAIISVIPSLAAAIGEGIAAMAESIANNAGRIVNAGVTLINSFLEGLLQTIPNLVSTGLQLLIALLQGLTEALPQIIELGMQCVIEFIKGVTQALPELVDAGFKMIIAFINGVADALRNNTDAIFDAIGNLLTAIGSFLMEGIARLLENIPGIGPGIADQIRAWKDDIFPAAKETGEGIKDGVNEGMEGTDTDVENMMVSAGGKIDDASDNFKSSAETAAQGVNEGFGQIDVDPPMNDMLATVESYQTPMQQAGIGNADVYGSGLIDQMYNIDPNGPLNSINSSITGKDGSFYSSGSSNASNYGSGLVGGINSSGGRAVGAVEGVVSDMGSVSSSGEGETVGSNFGWGIYNGMESVVGSITSQARSLVRRAIDAANDEQASASPSKIMMKSGRWFGEGYAIGIGQMIWQVVKNSRNMVSKAVDEVDDGMSILTGLMQLQGIEDPVIRPVFDLSGIEDGIHRMNSMLPSTSYKASLMADRVWGSPSTEVNTQNQNGGNHIEVHLDWRAGATANDVVMELATLLEQKNLMEV